MARGEVNNGTRSGNDLLRHVAIGKPTIPATLLSIGSWWASRPLDEREESCSQLAHCHVEGRMSHNNASGFDLETYSRDQDPLSMQGPSIRR